MKPLIIILLALMGMSELSFACNEGYYNSWTIDASLGMAYYPNMTNHDGQVAVGRLSLGHTLLATPYWQVDIETGIQSGNSMRLDLLKKSIDALGGVPVEVKLKPLLDMLAGLKTQVSGTIPLVVWLKGGVAYRQTQVDRTSVNDLRGLSPEIQMGLGYRINEQATVNLGYQYIYGRKPDLIVNSLDETGVFRNTPAQQAVLLGFSFNFL